MRPQNIIEVFAFIIGFLAGSSIFFYLFSTSYSNKDIIKGFSKHFNSEKIADQPVQYNTALADELYDKVKILCLVLTQPANHETKAQHVKNSWGHKCNKLIFLSTENVTDTETIIISRIESRDILWGKVKNGFEQAYEKYYNDYDWFLKGDDDSYFIMENLRHTLYQYNPHTSLILGHKYALQLVKEGYMAGGGYILSKKALYKLVNKGIRTNKCRSDDKGNEDVEMGKCLQQEALFLDGRDLLEEKQFFPLGVTLHLSNDPIDYSFWYTKYEWHKSKRGGLKCCSKYLACMHYIKPKEMYFYEYLIYHVHPFGLDKHYETTLPSKLTFKELVNKADDVCSAPNCVEHEIIHHFDEDEKF